MFVDKVDRYREIIRRLIDEYASYKPSHGQIETEAVADGERDDYEVMHVGWDGSRRVHGSVVHIVIKCTKKADAKVGWLIETKRGGIVGYKDLKIKID